MIPSSIIKQASEQTGFPEEVVLNCTTAYWRFLKHTFQSMPLKDDMTEEEFNNNKFSVNVPGLGKFGCTYRHYQNIKNKHGRIQAKIAIRKSGTSG